MRYFIYLKDNIIFYWLLDKFVHSSLNVMCYIYIYILPTQNGVRWKWSSFLPVGSYNSYRKYVIPTFARLVKVIQICTMYLSESKIVSSSKTSADRVLDTHFDKQVLGGTQINRTLPFEDIFRSSQIYVILCLYVIRVQPYCLINARNTHFNRWII